MNEPGYLIHCSDGTLMHRSHKYIDRIKTSKGWRYIYEKSGAGARDEYNRLSRTANFDADVKNRSQNKLNKNISLTNDYYKSAINGYKKMNESLRLAGGDVDETPENKKYLDDAKRYSSQASSDLHFSRQQKQIAKTAEESTKIYAAQAKEAKFQAEMAKNRYYKTPLGKIDKAKERGSSYINKLKQRASKKKKK